MQTNRSFRVDRAEVGVGVLIVFIAMVLVAAVAAGVLISTSGVLQSRAQTTGLEATAEVSSNIKLTSIRGYVVSSKVDSLNFSVSLSAGGAQMDISKLVIKYTDGTNRQDFTYDSADDPSIGSDFPTAATKFRLHWLRTGDSATFTSASPEVMKTGDFVEIALEAPADIDKATKVEVLFVPEVGSPLDAGFTTPAGFGSATWVNLR